MTIPRDSLHLYLMFLDELKRVEVLAAANRFDGPPLRIMGIVEGGDRLENLMEAVGIDHLLVNSGGPFTPNFLCHPFTSNGIVNGLKKAFANADEIPLKILRNEKLTDEEESFRAPKSMTVSASGIKIGEGLERVASWFKNEVGDNQAGGPSSKQI